MHWALCTAPGTAQGGTGRFCAWISLIGLAGTAQRGAGRFCAWISLIVGLAGTAKWGVCRFGVCRFGVWIFLGASAGTA
jgi:hypothetical protein